VLDTSTPNLARAWDYLLGGRASFAADRVLARQLEELYPGIRDTLFSSRTYVADSVARVARAGVDQFLDIGSGLPTQPAVHDIARAFAPGARVACVDRDPAVTEHGAGLVPAGVRYLRGDLAEPEAILTSGDLTGFIDLSRPACLLLTLVLHVLDPGTARAVTGVLVRALAPGSYLIVTAAAAESVGLPESVWRGPFRPGDLASFLAGLELLPPGVKDGPAACATGFKAPP
jgi:SAM-dependent methyltransferase